MAGYIADRRLVISPDSSRVLGPDEEQTGYLLAAEGGEVSEADCQRYGLGPLIAGEQGHSDAESLSANVELAGGPPSSPGDDGAESELDAGHEISPIVRPQDRRPSPRKKKG